MRRIWNRPAYPVWSLATVDAKGQGNFNICTYVSTVSLQPKLVVVALYHHTKTCENAQATGSAVLQLLTESHVDIVRTCGRHSGREIDKVKRVSAQHPVSQLGPFPYLADAAGYMEIDFLDFQEVGGDHLLGIGKVTSSKNLSDAPVLTTDYLKERNIIR